MHINFKPIPGQTGDEFASDTVLGADVAVTNLPIQASQRSSSQQTTAGSFISSFLETFLKNADARAMNNQAIAQYNAEQSAKQKERRMQNLTLIGAMILVFSFAMIILTGKK